MEKHKYILVVEGLTELIYVRQFLMNLFQYDGNRLGIVVYQLKSRQVVPTSFAFGSIESEYFFQIIDANGDAQVFSTMLNRVSGFINAGFELVIGLSDMYGLQYNGIVSDSKIHPEVNEKFINEKLKIIEDNAYHNNLRYSYAIMEVEAWLLGMPCVLKHYNVDSDYIQLPKIGGLSLANPEHDFYHPTTILKAIAAAVGHSYGKHKSELESLLSDATKTDFRMLYQNSGCPSFAKFVNTIFGDATAASLMNS